MIHIKWRKNSINVCIVSIKVEINSYYQNLWTLEAHRNDKQKMSSNIFREFGITIAYYKGNQVYMSVAKLKKSF